jgi:hypothetical protein
MCISAVLFCLVGYGLGIMLETMLKSMLKRISAKGRNIDIVTQQEPTDEVQESSEFTPFTSTNFEQISNKEK